MRATIRLYIADRGHEEYVSMYVLWTPGLPINGQVPAPGGAGGVDREPWGGHILCGKPGAV